TSRACRPTSRCRRRSTRASPSGSTPCSRAPAGSSSPRTVRCSSTTGTPPARPRRSCSGSPPRRRATRRCRSPRRTTAACRWRPAWPRSRSTTPSSTPRSTPRRRTAGAAARSSTSRAARPARTPAVAWSPYPRVDPDKPATVTIGGLNIGVSTTGGNTDLAFEAAICLRNRENQLVNATQGGVPPTLAELYDDPSFQAEYPAWEAIRTSLENASVRPATPAYTSISIVLADLLNPPAQIDPDTIVARMATEVERAVNSEGLVP